MNEKVNPEEFVTDNEQLEDQICEGCGTLVVRDLETGERICNCAAKAEEVALIAKAREQQKQAQAVAPQPRPVPQNVAPVETSAPVVVPETPAAPEGEMPVFNSRDALRAIPGAPSQEQIDVWKQEFGAIYTFPFDTKEIYIWRPMRRREWQMLQSNEALVKEENKFQEQVVVRAILWPKMGPVELNLSRAGLVQTMFSVIMQGSYFLHPDFAISLVEEL
jgi:hypothetical protein